MIRNHMNTNTFLQAVFLNKLCGIFNQFFQKMMDMIPVRHSNFICGFMQGFIHSQVIDHICCCINCINSIEAANVTDIAKSIVVEIRYPTFFDHTFISLVINCLVSNSAGE